MQGARYTCVGFRNRCLWSIEKRNANITVQGGLLFFHRGPAATACGIPRSALVSILLQANEAVDGHALLERELHHLHGGPNSGAATAWHGATARDSNTRACGRRAVVGLRKTRKGIEGYLPQSLDQVLHNDGSRMTMAARDERNKGHP